MMAKKIDVMDANEWMATFKQGLENANEFQGKNFTTDLSQIFTDERLFNADGSPKYNTNWQDEASVLRSLTTTRSASNVQEKVLLLERSLIILTNKVSC